MADEADGRWDPGPRPSYHEPVPVKGDWQLPPSMEVAPWGRGGGQSTSSCKTLSRFKWLWALLRALRAFVRIG